jgi:hypothetical protein
VRTCRGKQWGPVAKFFDFIDLPKSVSLQLYCNFTAVENRSVAVFWREEPFRLGRFLEKRRGGGDGLPGELTRGWWVHGWLEVMVTVRFCCGPTTLFSYLVVVW